MKMPRTQIAFLCQISVIQKPEDNNRAQHSASPPLHIMCQKIKTTRLCGHPAALTYFIPPTANECVEAVKAAVYMDGILQRCLNSGFSTTMHHHRSFCKSEVSCRRKVFNEHGWRCHSCSANNSAGATICACGHGHCKVCKLP